MNMSRYSDSCHSDRSSCRVYSTEVVVPSQLEHKIKLFVDKNIWQHCDSLGNVIIMSKYT